jgi:hypothetical protein
MSPDGDMVNYRKQEVPSPHDWAREFHGFVGSNVQKILHNQLLIALDGARERLESYSGDELIKQQGFVAGLRHAIDALHLHDSRDIKRDFGYDYV